ncbi:MAG TPA: OpgC domain-containing protein, partial [Methylocystis sp.]|nr:OpgC domain-containing protein [Methylocystis sp.]
GWALRKVVEGPIGDLATPWLTLRLAARALQVYFAQLVITELAIALLAGAALLLDAPFFLDWHNASAVFEDPVRAQLGLALLSHQLGYFNILPLYVVLTSFAVAMALLDRHARPLLPLVSLTVYLYALATGANFRTWPIEGTWFFNPLSWQLIYVLGFLLAGTDGLGGLTRRWRRSLRWAAVPIVAAGAVSAWWGFSPDPVSVPAPKLAFVFDKTYLSPARLTHSLALVALIGGAYPAISHRLPRTGAFLSSLGRNSLNVFCVGSLLSLLAQIFRFVYGGQIVTDAIIVVLSVLAMRGVAWVSEWREHARARASLEQRSPS